MRIFLFLMILSAGSIFAAKEPALAADVIPYSNLPYRGAITTPATPPQQAALDYRVRQGDNLENIARQEGVPINTLIKNNKLRSPYRLRVGQVLCLRQCTYSYNKPKRAQYYRVRQGDNLERIAHHEGIRLNTLIHNNQLRSPYTLKVGQRLCLRFCAKHPPKQNNTSYYRIRQGDNLERIAQQQHVKLSRLIANNHLKSPYTLHPGQYLCLRHCHQPKKKHKLLQYYRVRRGDSLSTIAKRLGIKQSLIVQRNKLETPFTLQVGSYLCVNRHRPCSSENSEQEDQDEDTIVQYYTVKEGDSLRRIAAEYGLHYQDIAAWNHIHRPYTIYPGQKLQFNQHGNKQALGEGAVTLPNKRYRVRRYETLDYLSNRFDITQKRLIELNHLKKPYKLKSGKILCLNNPAPCLSQVHIAAKGETLELIAQLYDVEPSQLVKINMLDAPYKVYPDQRICLHKTFPCEGAERVNDIPDDWMPRLDWPLSNDHEVLVPFGRRAGRMNNGVDIAAIEGTPVLAAASGKVIFSGEKFDSQDKQISGYGKFIIIEHPNHIFTIYAHNSQNLSFSGRRVKQGDMIARSGTTGRTHQAVLHFELRKGTTAIDPLPYLPKRKTDIIYERR